jgi:hypothetical protein
LHRCKRHSTANRLYQTEVTSRALLRWWLHLDQTGFNAVGLYSLYELFPSLGQNYSCNLYFTDNAVTIAHAPASITPPSTANGRLSVAYTQLNTTRKENVVAQESMFIPAFSLCMSRICGIRRKPKTRLQMRITVSCHIFVIYLLLP